MASRPVFRLGRPPLFLCLPAPPDAKFQRRAKYEPATILHLHHQTPRRRHRRALAAQRLGFYLRIDSARDYLRACYQQRIRISHAHVAELVDAQDSGSCGATRGSSSLLVSTNPPSGGTGSNQPTVLPRLRLERRRLPRAHDHCWYVRRKNEILASLLKPRGCLSTQLSAPRHPSILLDA